MPMTAYEQLGSRGGDFGSVEYLYRAKGAADATALRSAVRLDTTNFPLTRDVGGITLARDSNAPNVDEVWIDPGGDTAKHIFNFSVRYVRPDRAEPAAPVAGDAPEISFEIAAAQMLLRQSKATVAAYDSSGSIANPSTLFRGAIQFDGEQVNGAEIIIPEARWSETHYLADATVTASFRRTVRGLVGKTNNATFRGRSAGEVLFMGASGSKRGSNPWTLTYQFAESPNATNLAVGPITVSSKGGWELLWVYYTNQDTTIGGVSRVVPVPKYAVVERVYDSADFTGLGIGTTDI
jgi:hypothetical protein